MANGFVHLVIIANEIADRRQREFNILRLHRRQLRDNFNPFEMSEISFVGIFRLSREAARYVLEAIGPMLQQSRRLSRIPITTRVLVTFNFYACGSYQRRIGQDFVHAVSQSVVSRCITEVTNTINNELLAQWVVFPTTEEERTQIKQRFHEEAQFPGVIGAVDGTHIAIVPPTIAQREDIYVNRKSYHSKNTQIICDYDLRIININARHPGSAADAFIWNQSVIKVHLENLYADGRRSFWLLGDSGYGIAPWLVTPILGAEPGTPQERFTNAQTRARNCVERCIGVLKGRFRCLRRDRTLHYTPQRAGKIINACAILHNICKHYRVPIPQQHLDPIDMVAPELENGAVGNVPINRNNIRALGEANRQQIVDRFFN